MSLSWRETAAVCHVRPCARYNPYSQRAIPLNERCILYTCQCSSIMLTVISTEDWLIPVSSSTLPFYFYREVHISWLSKLATRRLYNEFHESVGHTSIISVSTRLFQAGHGFNSYALLLTMRLYESYLMTSRAIVHAT